MTIGAGSSVLFEGTLKTLEANGGSVSNNTIVAADDASYSCAADGEGSNKGYINLRNVTYGSSPTEGAPLVILAAVLDMDGTADEQAPETTYAVKPVTTFFVNNVTSAQNFQTKTPVELPRKANYYLYNQGTGQTISSGWILEIIPVANGPHA